ncbi:MAG TPA: RDD family protein [Oculatellaceae cyanobacterium]
MTAATNQNAKVEPAGFAVRAGAIGIDLLVLFVLHIPVLIYTSTREQFMSTKTPVLIFDMLGLLYVGIMAIAIPFWLYPSWFEGSKMGGTPGKYIMGLEVIDRNGNHFGFWKVILRLFIQYVVVLIPSIFFVQLVWVLVPYMMPDFAPTIHRNIEYVVLVVYGLGLLWCFANRKQQTLFDLPLGRQVIYANTDAATGASNRNVSKLTRLKQLPRFAWETIPHAWGRVPFALYLGIAILAVAFDGVGLIWHWNQVQAIEAKIEQNGGADHFGKSLTDLHIKARDAWWSYDRVTSLLGQFFEKKQLRVYLTRENLLNNRLETVRKIAQVDAEYQNDSDMKDWIDFANSRVFNLGDRGQAFCYLAGCLKNKLEKERFLKLAVAYAPSDMMVLKAKFRFDNESMKMDDIKADQQMMEIAQFRANDFDDEPFATDLKWLQEKFEISTQILKYFPHNTLAMLISAETQAVKGERQTAESLYGQTTDIDQTDPLPFSRRALFYASGPKPDLDKASGDIDRALSMDVQPDYLEEKLAILEKKPKSDINIIRDAAEQLLRRKKDLFLLAPHAKYLSDHGEREEAQRLVHAACTAYDVFPASRIDMEDALASDKTYMVIIAPLRICMDVSRATKYDQGFVEIKDLISQVVPEPDRARVMAEVEKGSAATASTAPLPATAPVPAGAASTPSPTGATSAPAAASEDNTGAAATQSPTPK